MYWIGGRQVKDTEKILIHNSSHTYVLLSAHFMLSARDALSSSHVVVFTEYLLCNKQYAGAWRDTTA